MIHHSRPTNFRRLIVLASAAAILAASLASIPRTASSDEFGKPDRQARRISQIVATLMQQHLSNRKLNDEISHRALKTYFNNLDSMKMYFLKSDIDEFTAKYGDSLDDFLPEGEYKAAFDIFNRFLQRVDERLGMANELIDNEQDYTVEEEIAIDPDLIDYAEMEGELAERWRQRIKYNLLVFGTDKEEDNPDRKDPRERLHNRYRAFANRMKQFDNEDVIEMYVSAITTSFDPHTSYMSKSSYENFRIQMSLELDGIGATLQSTDDGLTVIRRIVPGGAAEKSGKIQVDDKIVAVGQGRDGEMTDILDMKLDDVVDMIRGKAGTIVRLSVLRPSSADIDTIEITRERIELKDSEANGKVFEAGEKSPGVPWKVGVIDLPSFYTDMQGRSANMPGYKSTTVDVRRLLDEFRAEGVDAVVLDLRSNGGGSLPEAIDCTGLFIDHGPVVQVKDMFGQVKVSNDQNFGMAWEGPLVVITSKFSASASEILAGAVQDYRRGLVVGDTSTHGKGTVQTLQNLAEVLLRTPNAPPTLGALKITIQQFYRPNGDSTQLRGVLSDIVIPSITDHLDEISESDLDYPVDFDQVSRASFTPLNLVTPDVIQQLAVASRKRIAASEEFRREEGRIERYVDQKDDKSISLNREAFLERRKELDAEREENKLLENQVNHTNTEIERTYYLDEVLNITADYLHSLRTDPLAQNR